jgi:hypothetical protein
MLRVPSGAARCSSARKMSGLCQRSEIQEQGRIEFRYALPILDLMIFVENFRQHIVSKVALPRICARLFDERIDLRFSAAVAR